MTTVLTYSFDTPKDYIVAKIGDQSALIDTGSPITMGKVPFELNGECYHTFPGIYGRDAESIGDDIGCKVTHLVGLNVLAEQPFLIDWQGKKLMFYPKGTVIGGEQVPLHAGLGLQLDFKANGEKHRGILDTGAPITFKPKDFPSGKPVGKLEDFFPQGGKFSTNIYKGQMQVGSRKYETRFGVIPGMMGDVLPWIVGSDLWQAGPVGFDIDHNRLHLLN